MMTKPLLLRKKILPEKGLYKRIDWVCMSLLSLLFSFFMVFGESFYKAASWNMVFGSTSQEVVALCKGLLFFVLFMFCFYFGWHFVAYPALRPLESPSKFRIMRLFDTYPFLFSWICFFLLYIPYFIAFYPGIIMSDTPDLIAQGFNLPDRTSDYLVLLNPEITLNQHHSVAHIMLLHICLVIGHLITDDWNVGLFIYSMFQACIMITVCSFCISELKKIGINRRYRLLVFVYFVASPRIQNYLFLATKDAIYAAALLAFIMCFYCIIANHYKKYHMVCFMAALIVMLLFRNDNKYLLVLMFMLTAVLIKKCRKWCCIMVPCILVAMYCYTSILLPSCGITPGSKREMLSIPFQQTARYLRDIPDSEITEEEKAAINAVLDYDVIKTQYDPERSDNVKNTFRETATSDDLIRYFKSWVGMLYKHPGIYIQATMNNVYDYFYPCGRPAGRYTTSFSDNCIDYIEWKYPNMHFGFHYNPNTATLRNLMEYYDALFCLPIFSLILTPAFYSWVVIICSIAALRRYNPNAFCVWLPMLITLLICIAGPCNGWYFRYLYPVAVAFPIGCVIHLKECSAEGRTTEKP